MRWITLALVAACSFQHGTLQQGPRDGAPIDTAVIDAPIDTMVMADSRPDATGPGCDSTLCATNGGTCSNGTCEITAQSGQAVTCPTLTSCDISCLQDNLSCRNGMTCAAGSTCAIHCEADHSCDNTSTLACSAGSTCEIFCKGNHACDALTITCATGATCKYHCCGTNACGGFSCQSSGGTCMYAGTTCP